MIKVQSAILKKIKSNPPIKTKKPATPTIVLTDDSSSTTSPTKSPALLSHPKAKKTFPVTPSPSPVKVESPTVLSQEVIQLDDSGTVTLKPSLSCSICPFTTRSANFFKRHESFHLSAGADYADATATDPLLTPSHSCSSCVFICQTESDLDAHVLAVHGNMHSIYSTLAKFMKNLLLPTDLL